MKNLFLGAFYLSLAASIWGGMFVAVRISVEVIPPVQLVWLRYVTAFFTLYILGRVMHVSWRVRRRDWKLVFLVGLVGQTISIVTQETGTMLTSAQTGSVITASTPAFMVIFARLLLHERFTAGRVMSVILASIGVLFIVIDPDNVRLTGFWGGISLVVAALTWAIMSVLLKLLPDYSPIVLTFYGVAVAVVLLAPYSIGWLLHTDWMPMYAPRIWSSVLYLGAISTSVGFCLWNKGLLLMDASVGGLFLFFQPVVGTFLGWAFLGESVTAFFWLGSALVAVGVVLAMCGGTDERNTVRDAARECH